ncbi:MAG TPA: asparagine synthase (glutamine-hydrolyzing) [Chitinophagaceae bacterium]
MCGIAGIIQLNNGGYGNAQLKQMTDAIAHRGPDGDGIWHNPSSHALLGHRRMAVIDLSDAAAQPMHYLDRYTIVHNGEIYNYLELKEELSKQGYRFHTQSDTEVIMAAYDHWDEDCVGHFDGMFAFAIWDEKEQELFAARDRFGEKPFFYSFDGNSFVFASEMKALWAVGIPRQPNLQMLFNFLTIGYVDNPSRPEETFFKNINKLPAASHLFYFYPDNELIIDKYWDIASNDKHKQPTDEEAIEEFTTLFNTSVKRRLRSDVRIGTSLSGGLDSSSVVAMIDRLKGSQYSSQAFTAVFPGFEKDEATFSRLIADSFGLVQHTVAIQPEDMLDDWEQLCYHQEEPFASASIYAQYRVYKLAKQHSIRVLLDGQGADEMLAGYHKYYKWYWQELFVKRKLVSSGELKAARELGVSESFGVKNIIASLFPDLASVVLERQYLVNALRQEDLTREFVRLQSKEAYYSTPEYFNLNGALYFNSFVHGLEELLRYADRNSMAFAREVRLPFLSHELVEFIFSLDSRFKIRHGRTKWLLRTVMEDKLPAAITWRKDKVGFEPPQQQWMHHPRWQEAIKEARKRLVEEKILKENVLEKPIIPMSSHAADNFDWRYLSAAAFLE